MTKRAKRTPRKPALVWSDARQTYVFPATKAGRWWKAETEANRAEASLRRDVERYVRHARADADGASRWLNVTEVLFVLRIPYSAASVTAVGRVLARLDVEFRAKEPLAVAGRRARKNRVWNMPLQAGDLT